MENPSGGPFEGPPRGPFEGAGGGHDADTASGSGFAPAAGPEGLGGGEDRDLAVGAGTVLPGGCAAGFKAGGPPPGAPGVGAFVGVGGSVLGGRAVSFFCTGRLEGPSDLVGVAGGPEVFFNVGGAVAFLVVKGPNVLGARGPSALPGAAGGPVGEVAVGSAPLAAVGGPAPLAAKAAPAGFAVGELKVLAPARPPGFVGGANVFPRGGPPTLLPEAEVVSFAARPPPLPSTAAAPGAAGAGAAVVALEDAFDGAEPGVFFSSGAFFRGMLPAFGVKGVEGGGELLAAGGFEAGTVPSFGKWDKGAPFSTAAAAKAAAGAFCASPALGRLAKGFRNSGSAVRSAAESRKES